MISAKRAFKNAIRRIEMNKKSAVYLHKRHLKYLIKNIENDIKYSSRNWGSFHYTFDLPTLIRNERHIDLEITPLDDIKEMIITRFIYKGFDVTITGDTIRISWQNK